MEATEAQLGDAGDAIGFNEGVEDVLPLLGILGGVKPKDNFTF